MKKKILTLLFALMLFFNTKNVSADCNFEEQAKLNKEAANIKVSYAENKRSCNMQDNWCGLEEGEDMEGQTPDEEPGPVYEEDEYTDEVEYFDISILNVTENLYVKVKNNVGFGPKQFNYSSAKDGVITFYWDNIMDVANFTFEVYSSSKTSCPNEKVRVLYLTTPRLNLFSNYEICDEYPEYEMCKKYITTKTEVDHETFVTNIKKYSEKAENKDQQNGNGNKDEDKNILKQFINDNKMVIFIGGASLVVVVLVVGFITKGKKKNETKW